MSYVIAGRSVLSTTDTRSKIPPLTSRFVVASVVQSKRWDWPYLHYKVFGKAVVPSVVTAIGREMLRLIEEVEANKKGGK